MARAAPPQILRLALDLDVDQLPIAGTLQHHSAAPEPFDGWLELIAAIEALLTGARNDPPPTQQEDRP
jgi:hypothetical protein